jgi:hypothetical protein
MSAFGQKRTSSTGPRLLLLYRSSFQGGYVESGYTSYAQLGEGGTFSYWRCECLAVMISKA